MIVGFIKIYLLFLINKMEWIILVLMLFFIFFIFALIKMRSPKKKSILNKCQKYISNTKDDWNYILPTDFYKNYYKLLESGDNKDFVLIDLRKEDVFSQYHIKNSINIFWLDLLKEENINKLPKKKKIFLICYVGHTSSQAMVLLRLLGYNVTSIKYGYGISPISNVNIAGWLNYNLPVYANST
jgi:rhodanese-related sulfurtransferase